MRFKIPVEQPRSFRSSARYLAGLTAGVSPDRVEWMFGTNLYTLEPNAAAAVMDATASRNTRCQQAVYHFVITFDPKDARRGKIDPEKMRSIADDVIERLGLGEYQSLVYAHKDTKHPHMHFLVNRVHPVTGKALSRHNDGRRLTELCREVARERNLNIPKDHARIKEIERVDDFDLTAAPTEGEYWKARKEKRDPDRPFNKAQILAYREDLKPLFFGAKTWGDLDERLKPMGLYLVPKGQGLIITDGSGYMKLSDLHNRDLRLPLLNERYGERFHDWTMKETEARIREEERDMPPPPNLEGLDREQQNRAKISHERKVEVIRGRKGLDLLRTDIVKAFDRVDSDTRYWQQILRTYDWAERRAVSAEKSIAFWEERITWGNTRVGVREGRMMESLEKVFEDVEAASKKWAQMEKEKGFQIAAAMVARKPHILGRMSGTNLLGIADKERKAAERALGRLVDRRRKWLFEKEKLEAVRNRQQKQREILKIALREYELSRRTTGSREYVLQILEEKIKLRVQAIERVTPRMLERADITERKRRYLLRAYREYHEFKRRERDRGISRDLSGRDR